MFFFLMLPRPPTFTLTDTLFPDTTPFRSAIFYASEVQRQIAEDTIADVEASGLWPGKVVTELAPAGDFWEAEPEHQDYLQHYPSGYTCHFIQIGRAHV